MGGRPHWRGVVVIEATCARQHPAKGAYQLTTEGRLHSRSGTAEGILPAFTPLEDSLFLTLCARALDNRSPHPVLADATADEIVRKLDYDYGQFHLNTNIIVTCAHRAKKLDEIASGFLDRHPNGIGVDLGTGLDSRIVRIAPPSTSDWYDIDFPDVIAARELLIPGRPNTHAVGADLTGEDWLDAIPTDRAAVIVADGLMAFLTLDEMISLVNRIISHFPSGEIAFNSYTKFAIRAAKHSHGTQSVANLVKFPGFDDPREPERWNPKLKLIKEILLCREPEVADFPRTLRLYNRVLALNTRLSRKATIVLHYRF
jgi:O-methyltransferase involved in polyketide biosynthesis